MINLAIIGYGHWGRNHARTVENSKQARLITICDLHDQTCLNINIPQTVQYTNDYKLVLRNEHIDAVIIATPTASHYSITKEALKAGKHVLVEKPITTSSEEALELVNLANQTNLTLMVGDTFRYNAGVRYLQELIRDGELGQVRSMESRRVGLGPIRNDVSALWDLATHDIYIATSFLRKQPDTISYQGISFNNHLDDVVSLTLKFSDPSVLAHIFASWIYPLKQRSFTVVGTKKAALFDDIQLSNKITLFDVGVDFHPSTGDYGEFQASTRDGDILIPKLKLEEPLKVELEHFLECIATGKQSISSGYEGLQTVKILEAAEKSKKQGGLEIRI